MEPYFIRPYSFYTDAPNASYSPPSRTTHRFGQAVYGVDQRRDRMLAHPLPKMRNRKGKRFYNPQRAANRARIGCR